LARIDEAIKDLEATKDAFPAEARIDVAAGGRSAIVEEEWTPRRRGRELRIRTVVSKLLVATPGATSATNAGVSPSSFLHMESAMNDEIQLFSDGDGLAVIGEPSAVERFLSAEGLQSKDLGLHRLKKAMGVGSELAKTGSTISENAGRWVQLSESTMRKIDQYGLMKGSSGELSRGVIQADGGQIKALVEFTRGSGAILTNPAVLAGAAGIMAQLAMQAAMDEITDYLAVIDEKVDDILRAQKDAVLADMIGVDFVIEEAMTIRKQVGKVSETTWSKVQGTSMTIARTQAYTLRQLDALASKLESKSNVDELAKTAKAAGAKVHEWLAVLARCFQLQDAIAILEIDRVLDAAPEELDQHRIALRTARYNRMEHIGRSTIRLMARMDAAAGISSMKILLNPISTRAVVSASNRVGEAVVEFHTRLGIEQGRDAVDAKRWLEAAVDVRDDALAAGVVGVEAAKRFGDEAYTNARSVSDKLVLGFAERALRRRGNEKSADEE